MTDASEGHLRFRPDIEGLRAVAILAVVLYHARWSWAGGGFFGVDVFFVLSGFLISGIIVDEIAKTGTLSLVNFWARRARRLLPAATFITLVVLVADISSFALGPQIRIANTARAFAVYGSNILFAVRSTDYFGGIATRDPLLHTWSLSVEEQFYVIFAPAMLLLALVARKYDNASFRRWLSWLAVVLSVLSFAGCILLVRRYPTIAFFALPSRAWEFGLGAMALLALRFMPRLGALTLEAISIASVAVLIASVALLNEHRAPPLGFASLAPTLATVGLILTGAGAKQTLVARALSTSPMRLLGRLSYSWYLWHWPALIYLRATVRGTSLATNIAVAVLSLLPAAAMYAWIETPIRYSKYLKRNPRLAVAGAFVLAAFTYGAGTLAIMRAERLMRSPPIAKILTATRNPRMFADGCELPMLGTHSGPCEYGPGTNDTTLVVLGDSHGAHWFPAFDSVATLRGWKIVNWTKQGCPAADVHVFNLGRIYTECEQWKRETIDRIVKRRPTIVVVSEDKTYNVVMPNGEQLPADSSVIGRRVWYEGLTRTLTALVPSGAKLIVMGDTPLPLQDVPQCLVRNLQQQSRCDVRAEVGLNPAVAAMERAAVRAIPGVSYINLNENMCEGGTCWASKNGVVRYQDSNHLSVAFSASLAPQMSRALTDALNGSRPQP